MTGAADASLTAVQVGGGWFAERAGGLNRYYADLVRALPGAGVACRGLVVGTSRVEDESGGVVRAYAAADAPLPVRWRAARSAVRRAWSEGGRPADLLVTHFAPYAFPLGRVSPAPTVVHFHGPWAAESRREGAGRAAAWAKAAIERSVYRRASRFVVLSAAFGDLLVSDYGVDPARVRVVPGGVDLARFGPAAALDRSEARRRLGWPTDRPVVLSVRRLAGRMGLERLIDAIGEVRRRVADVLCLIAGRGRLEAELSDRIAAAGLADHVRLLGFVPDADLPTAYRAADVSVLPTEALEGFGLSAAESLAAGTPVLVTAVGGLPEVVAGLGDRLVLPADPAAWAGRVSDVLLRPAGLPSSAECSAHARDRFDWTAVARRVAGVYRNAVSRS